MFRLVLAICFVGVLNSCSGSSDACPTDGTGQLALAYSGLGLGLVGTVHLTGTGNQTLTTPSTVSLAAGPYTVTADLTVVPDTIVRTVWKGTASSNSICIKKDQTTNLAVTWATIATSNKLWASNGSGGSGDLLGFASANLHASGTPLASTASNGPGGISVAFDKDGNLWALGPTVADSLIARFPASAFQASGTIVPDIKIDIPSITCVPRASGLAFDPDGNLWVSSPCDNSVMKLATSQLAASGSIVPTLKLSGFMDPEGMAFDSAGNLWVADKGLNRLRRYDHAQLALTSPTVSLDITTKATTNPSDTTMLSPSWLAFDSSGNLWANDFGGNTLFRVTAADQTGTGTKTVTPAIQISISVSALIEGLAFDESGALWMPLSQGHVGRLDASQLTTSSTSGSPTTPAVDVHSADIGYAGGLAFYPAPSALPLFHRLP